MPKQKKEVKIKGLGKLNKRERRDYAKYAQAFMKAIHLPEGMRLEDIDSLNEEIGDEI